jgi:hypothetical protein
MTTDTQERVKTSYQATLRYSTVDSDIAATHTNEYDANDLKTSTS